MTDLRPIYFAEARARLVGNRLAVYAALIDAGPSTPKELAARMGWDVTSVRPRITEMRKGYAEKVGSVVAVTETGVRRNGEHEFRALTAVEMKDAHERARLDEQFVKRACEYLAKPAGTFRELKQMEIFA